MSISLRKVDKSNYEAICDLDVAPHQEGLVACNMWSLVEANFNDGHVTRGIYQDEIPVGFFMWVYESASKVSIWRFMIDKAFQQRGIGRVALNQALQEIKQDSSVMQIAICYQPQNPIAANFYGNFGFVEIGMDEDGDDMLAIINLKNELQTQ